MANIKITRLQNTLVYQFAKSYYSLARWRTGRIRENIATGVQINLCFCKDQTNSQIPLVNYVKRTHIGRQSRQHTGLRRRISAALLTVFTIGYNGQTVTQQLRAKGKTVSGGMVMRHVAFWFKNFISFRWEGRKTRKVGSVHRGLRLIWFNNHHPCFGTQHHIQTTG